MTDLSEPLLRSTTNSTTGNSMDLLSSSSTVEQLTLEEKLRLLSGQSLWSLAEIPRLSLPSLTVADGPHGVRKPLTEMSLQESLPATCFPPACALACSWNVDLLYCVGKALREECLHYQICILLGPGLNLKRHAGGGRNFEYFSEDPLLSSRLAAAYVRGVQTPLVFHEEEYTVGACLKHYAVNNQESHRFVVDAIVDDRTLHELYLSNFIDAVRESQPSTVMCAYNLVNGQFCAEHNSIYSALEEVWKPRGVVMTDWGATDNRAAAIQVGCDLEMPGSHGAHDRAIRAALKSGQVTMSAIDSCCERLVALIRRHGSVLNCIDYPLDFDAQQEKAKLAALECIVLLQNNHNLLPLESNSLKSLAVIGDFSRQARFQGMGSSQVTPARISHLADELKRYVRSTTTTTTFARGYDPNDDDNAIQSAWIDEAVEVARSADVVLLHVGLPEILESEGFDRMSLSLPIQHIALIQKVTAVHDQVIVILTNGGMIELVDEAMNASAILEGYLLGQAGAAAMADVLFGAATPSGKLAETMPITKTDLFCDPYFPGNRCAVEYREGLDVGYRYLDTVDRPVRFPFGHGLSYTTFTYSDLRVCVRTQTEVETSVHVSFQIENTGLLTGREVAQCYVHDLASSVYRPIHELRDFANVLLEPREKREVVFNLTRSAFAFYDIGVSDWMVEVGEFEIQIGSSSRDLRLRSTIEITNGNPISSMAQESYPPKLPEQKGVLTVIDDTSFATRFGLEKDNVLELIFERRKMDEEPLHPSLSSSWRTPPHHFHRNSLLKEIAECRYLGQLILHIVFSEATSDIKPGPTKKRQMKMVRATVENLPLRTLVLFSKGGLSHEALDTMIAIMNRDFCFASVTAFKAIYAAIADTRAGLLRR